MLIPHWVRHAIETYGYWGVLVAVALESTGVPFPGETALLAAAVYAGTTGRINPVLVIAAAAAGAILGDNLGFAIGHFGGYPLLQRIVRFLHLDERAIQYAQQFFAKHGDKTVFVGRFFALLRTYVALLAGINRMHWRTFLLWNALGGITWATIFGILGFVLGNNLPLLGTVLQVMGIGGFVLLGIFIMGIIFFIVRARRRTLAKALDSADAKNPTDTKDVKDVKHAMLSSDVRPSAVNSSNHQQPAKPTRPASATTGKRPPSYASQSQQPQRQKRRKQQNRQKTHNHNR